MPHTFIEKAVFYDTKWRTIWSIYELNYVRIEKHLPGEKAYLDD
jgi:hypothetical protein